MPRETSIQVPMLPVIHASLVVWIGVGWLVAMCLALLFVVPLCIAAKRAAAVDDEVETVLAPAFDRLADLRAPSGQPFFATPSAREDLIDEVQELVLPSR